MFDGVATFGPFDGGWTASDVEQLHEPLELFEGSSSFSLRFRPWLPSEVPSSVALKVLLDRSSSEDMFVASPTWTWTVPQTEIAFSSGKAGLSGTGLRGAGGRTRLAAEPSYDIPEGTARFFARMERDAYYSDAGFASRGFIRASAPEEGIGPIYRAGQRGKDGWSWGAVRPNSVPQAKSFYRPLEQLGEPDTLFVGRIRPDAPYWTRFHPESGIRDYNVAPEYVDWVVEPIPLPGV